MISAANTTPRPMGGQCNFESGLDACGYENVRFYDFYWLLHSGETATKGTGPSVDHTTGTKDGRKMKQLSLSSKP